jgi:hypothetical protein
VRRDIMRRKNKNLDFYSRQSRTGTMQRETWLTRKVFNQRRKRRNDFNNNSNFQYFLDWLNYSFEFGLTNFQFIVCIVLAVGIVVGSFFVVYGSWGNFRKEVEKAKIEYLSDSNRVGGRVIK